MPSDVSIVDPMFDPSSADFRVNPYPVYCELREKDPVHWSPYPGGGFWVLSRYKDVASLLPDRRLGMSGFTPLREMTLGRDAAYETLREWMLFKDGSDHSRLRRLVSRAFSPRAIELMRPRIDALVREMLAEPQERETIDIIRDVAFPLPVYVIADMLGVPREDRHQFHGWTQAVNLAFEFALSPEQVSLCNSSARQLGDYLGVLVQDRRKRRGEDLLSALIETQDGDHRLSDSEIVANAGMLLAGGFETTMGLIGNGVLALMENTDELLRLQREPVLIPNAVEEFMRYNSPVQYGGRFVVEPVQLDEKTFQPGEFVTLLIGSANRDPERFTDPDRLDVGRRDVEHLSFGGGPHYCIGAPLARLEGDVVFRNLVPILNDPEVIGTVSWRESALNHVPESLPLRFRRVEPP
jgi:cytochrome P450